MKTRVIFDKKSYTIELFMMEPLNGVYKFGLQIWGGKALASYSMRLSEEFVEDELDNEKKSEYLEALALRVAENHLRDIMFLPPNAVAANLAVWFKEAKRALAELRPAGPKS